MQDMVAGENGFKMFFKKITMQHYIIQLDLVVIDNIGKGLITVLFKTK